MKQHILEITVYGNVTHLEYIPSTDSAIDVFYAHLQQSEPGEVISLYEDHGTVPSMRTLVERKRSGE